MKLHFSVFRDFWKLILKKKNSGELEKESIIRVRVGHKSPSLRITVRHHSASFVMPNGDPQTDFSTNSHTHDEFL